MWFYFFSCRETGIARMHGLLWGQPHDSESFDELLKSGIEHRSCDKYAVNHKSISNLTCFLALIQNTLSHGCIK